MNAVQLLFYAFATIAIASGLMVIISNNPVRSALFLVMTFITTAILWLMMQAEFLALVLIFVYVGAVMTLFLFVVMMLNVKNTPLRRQHYVRFLPLGVMIIALMIVLMIYVIGPHPFGILENMPDAGENNTRALGQLLYTVFAYPFELAGILLLVAIVAVISLAFRGRKPDTRAPLVSEQIKVQRDDRLTLITEHNQESTQ